MTQYHLPQSQYYPEVTQKKSIYIHHTAGWDNPKSVVDSWAKDARGRIATHYLIGGINPATGDDTNDGMVVEAIAPKYWAHHLGVNRELDKSSISIELCSMGYLEYKHDKYHTYVGKPVTHGIYDLGHPWRGYRWWCSYSEAQITALKTLLMELSATHGIDLKSGLQERLIKDIPTGFDYSSDVVYQKKFGLFSHSNVRRDKFDCYPHEALVAMILGL